MTALERGYLLLCADLGTQQRPLTARQLRALRLRVQTAAPPKTPERELDASDLRALGYAPDEAARIAALLSREAELDAYLKIAASHGIGVITSVSRSYPERLRDLLGDQAPPVLFYRGELSLLQKRCVSLVGSRELREPGRAFAERVGTLAAREGFVLVSGNAPGADRAAQDACLRGGGSVISVLADSLVDHAPPPRALFLCEDGWHLPFTAQRALRRNRILHVLGQLRLVAQCADGTGGTWRGTVEALRLGLSVFVHDDGSDGARALAQQGAELLPLSALHELTSLCSAQTRCLSPDYFADF